jgi:DNA topoisomerase-1
MEISSPVKVAGAPTACEYRYTAEQVIKPGWKLVAGGYDKEAMEYTYFASLVASAASAAMPFKRIMTKCSLRNTKSHYTESGLVQMLEKMGIGRPSTFSSLIDKIQERGYVKLKDVPGKSIECREFVITKNSGQASASVESKTEVREMGGESRKLVIQPLGIIVIEFLLAHFAPLFEYEFTKNMENQLDEIATDGMVWHELCYKGWFEVAAQLQELKERGVVKEEIQIDDRHSYIMGKNGPVIRCRVTDSHADDSSDTDADTDADTEDDAAEKKPKFIFKSVRPNLEYAKIQRGEYSLAYMLGEAEHVGGGAGATGSRGEADVNEGGSVAVAGAGTPVSVAGGGRLMGQYQGQDIVTKSGKYGAYVVWGSMNLSLKPLLGGGGRGGKTEFDLTLQDVIAFIQKSTGGGGGGGGGEAGEATSTGTGTTPFQGQILRTIDENTTIRYGRYGPYIFHKTQKMTKPAFVALKGFPEAHGNYITCDVAKIHEWISADAAAPPKPKPKFGFFKKK